MWPKLVGLAKQSFDYRIKTLWVVFEVGEKLERRQWKTARVWIAQKISNHTLFGDDTIAYIISIALLQLFVYCFLQ
jgi:hypothetical protein